MGNFFVFLPAAALLLVTLAAISLSAGFLMRASNRIGRIHYRRFVVGRYNKYYITDDDIRKDERGRMMLPVINKGYSEDLEEYMSRITEDRLPPCVIMNWVRSIAEDVASSPFPILAVKNWHDFMAASSDKVNVVNNSDFIEFERYEECYIWGCVNRWLELYEPDIVNDDLKKAIFRTACPKQYLKPYFDITFMTQEEKKDLLNGLFQGAQLTNTQINVVVENGSSVSFYGNGKAMRQQVSDEQIARALEKLNGREKTIDSQRAWLGACLLLGYKYDFPRNLGECCKKIQSLPIRFDTLEFRCDYESIRKYGSWKFVKERYEDWPEYRPRDDERAVFEKCLAVAQALDNELQQG